MKFLFVGGTGVISSEITKLALKKGHEVFLLNRNGSKEYEALGARHIKADIREKDAVKGALRGMSFDAVADFVCYTEDQAAADCELFGGMAGQYVFISSASAYQKPARWFPITESAPLKNPFWQYSRDKIACEDYFTKRYREDGFPVTIVRPSHTYGLDKLPVPVSGAKTCWTYLEMMRRGEPIIVPGDGMSLWTVTHNSDFAVGFCGLLGRSAAIGHPFHITSDEYLKWNAIIEMTGKALGVCPNIVHLPSDMIIKKFPEYEGPLLGDKAECAIFDNTKIKRLVPEYRAVTPFETGIRQVIEYMYSHPETQTVDEGYISKMRELAGGL